MIRISLTAEDFRQLVRGQVIDKTKRHSKTVVQICIQDIGFDVMFKAVDQAARQSFQEKRHERDAPADH